MHGHFFLILEPVSSKLNNSLEQEGWGEWGRGGGVVGCRPEHPTSLPLLLLVPVSFLGSHCAPFT